MNDVYTLQIPAEAIASAVRVAVSAKRDLVKLDEERKNMVVTTTANLPADRQGIKVSLADAQAIVQRGAVRSEQMSTEETNVYQYAGEPGVQVFREKVAEWEERRAQAIADTRAQLADLHAQAVEFIDAETIPDGADLMGEQAEGDMRLIQLDLIDTPEQLEAIVTRHNNPAFRRVASKYAEGREWEHFKFFDKEKSIREFTNQVFDGLSRSVAIPQGISAAQYIDTPSEIERIAAAYGLADEWQASDGDLITRAYE